MFNISFFPLGNADTTRIIVPNSERLLFDFAPLKSADGVFDLEANLNSDLEKAEKDGFEIVCITHLDHDHCRGFEDYFYLRHSKGHQHDERKKIETLWVPADVITEATPQNESAKRVQKEAQHRLKKGDGVLVFSHPKGLDDWFADNDIDPQTRSDCIVHAGSLVPGWTLENQKIQFFVHSPLSWKQDTESGEVDRNSNSIVVQATMKVEERCTNLFLGADVDSDDLTEIVRSTNRHNNLEHLDWDVLKLFHHCSYKALNKEDRGETETTPAPKVKDLIEMHGTKKSIIVSPSEVIPARLSKEGDLPPHKQAANYYRRIQSSRSGEFKVTMATPSTPIEIQVSSRGAGIKSALTAPAVATSTAKPARAG